MATDRPADAAFVQPDATVTAKILMAPQVPSVGPAGGRTVVVVEIRPRSGLSRQFRSFPLLV